jgi:hypothetical protein
MTMVRARRSCSPRRQSSKHHEVAGEQRDRGEDHPDQAHEHARADATALLPGASTRKRITRARCLAGRRPERHEIRPAHTTNATRRAPASNVDPRRILKGSRQATIAATRRGEIDDLVDAEAMARVTRPV